MVIYFMYGVHNSKVKEETQKPEASVFLLRYDSDPEMTYDRPRRCPSSDEGPDKSSSESEIDDDGFLSNAIITDEERHEDEQNARQGIH